MSLLIECQQIEKIYGSGEAAVHALRGIDLEVEHGEGVAIVGPSGSGKSTLLQILGCLDLPTSGDYLLDGVDVSQLGDDALSELRGAKIGFVFQAFHLFPRFTLLDNVALPLLYQNVDLETRRTKAKLALERVKLGHRIHHKPHQLSGGEKQRGAIARAIVHDPALILADEPTGNLDSQVRDEILDHFTNLNRELGVTIMIVTHDNATADWARRKLLFEDGRIVKEVTK